MSEQEVAKARLDLALVHYPVLNKNQEKIGSAVTNLDLHDIARAAKTYGVDSLYIVTPYKDQQELFRELLDHWLSGHGAEYNSKRGEALSLVQICDDLDQLYAKVTEKWQRQPIVLATCARKKHSSVWSYSLVRQKISDGESVLILFGTAWGLAREVIAAGDGILPPITGAGDYNHLSVRSAAAIILDRLLGVREI
ncbi:MAG: RNA methyltransferase [Desulfobulbales bacterium]|nr:RNA methyltransferase [Desulfobulbales bacterium]